MSGHGARLWPWVPAALLTCMLAGLGSMAAIAMRDPGFALERDYYQKAVAYDGVIAQRATNARLGWFVDSDVGRASSPEGTLVVIRLKDAVGPITGAHVSVEALRNAAAAVVLEASLAELSPGEYTCRLPMRHGGLWELRMTAERGRDRFTTALRTIVSEAAP